MRDPLGRDRAAGPLTRGLTRRDLGRLALLTAGAALPFYNEAALAQDLKAIGALPRDAVRINANENPLGPCASAVAAARDVTPDCGRYHFDKTYEFVEAMAQVEGLPESHIMPFAGSSDPLHRSVLAFTSAKRPLVLADPGYEAPERAAAFIGSKALRVPLRKDFSHDASAMLAASPNAGVIYICNPNNPTGTLTSRADIDEIVAKKPEGCLVLIDEAYIHFTTATPTTDLVAAGKDVIVLRTFSKLYGMAGLRAGAALGRPDLLDKLKGYTGLSMLPATAMAAATASLRDKALVPERRKVAAEVREGLFSWLSKKGYHFIPSEANMVLVDGRRPARQTSEAMLKHGVAIGRAWSALPTYSRVTIGTREEMQKFRDAFDKVMNA